MMERILARAASVSESTIAVSVISTTRFARKATRVGRVVPASTILLASLAYVIADAPRAMAETITTIDFDNLNASTGPTTTAALQADLQPYGITITNGQDSKLIVDSKEDLPYLDVALGMDNFLSLLRTVPQPQPVMATMTFATAYNEIMFYTVGNIGLETPATSIIALNAQGLQVGSFVQPFDCCTNSDPQLVTIKGNGIASLQFNGLGIGSPGTDGPMISHLVLISNTTGANAPEPASWVLIAAGLALIGAAKAGKWRQSWQRPTKTIDGRRIHARRSSGPVFTVLLISCFGTAVCSAKPDDIGGSAPPTTTPTASGQTAQQLKVGVSPVALVIVSEKTGSIFACGAATTVEASSSPPFNSLLPIAKNCAEIGQIPTTSLAGNSFVSMSFSGNFLVGNLPIPAIPYGVVFVGNLATGYVAQCTYQYVPTSNAGPTGQAFGKCITVSTGIQ